jgi:hypothetical protein
MGPVVWTQIPASGPVKALVIGLTWVWPYAPNRALSSWRFRRFLKQMLEREGLRNSRSVASR